MSSYVTTARGWWKFNRSLADEIATADFEILSGVSSSSYKSFREFNIYDNDFETKYGLLLKENQKYSADIGGSFVSGGITSLALSMIYYSPNPIGLTRHVTTRETTHKVVPIVAKANTTISGGDEIVTSGEGEWIVNEIGYSKTQNAIQVYVCGANNYPTDVYISEPYDPGLIKVFITLVFSSTSNYARIDINGKFGNQHTKLTDLRTPSSTVAPIRLNDIGFGPIDHKTYDEERYIADLVLKMNGENNSSQMVKSIQFGPNSILDSGSDSIKRSFLGIGYDQPETVTTNQIYSEGGNIFVVRSNGEILEGHKPIWSNDYNFSTGKSVSNLTVTRTGTAEWTPEGLKFQGATIRV